jgi:prevent-host-death family protein
MSRFSRMKTWPLQDAKNQFSELVESALADGPQTVTRHGEPVAVIVSADEYKRLARPRQTVLEFFLPLKGSGIRLERRRDLPRKLKL